MINNDEPGQFNFIVIILYSLIAMFDIWIAGDKRHKYDNGWKHKVVSEYSSTVSSTSSSTTLWLNQVFKLGGVEEK